MVLVALNLQQRLLVGKNAYSTELGWQYKFLQSYLRFEEQLIVQSGKNKNVVCGKEMKN